MPMGEGDPTRTKCGCLRGAVAGGDRGDGGALWSIALKAHVLRGAEVVARAVAVIVGSAAGDAMRQRCGRGDGGRRHAALTARAASAGWKRRVERTGSREPNVCGSSGC